MSRAHCNVGLLEIESDLCRVFVGNSSSGIFRSGAALGAPQSGSIAAGRSVIVVLPMAPANAVLSRCSSVRAPWTLVAGIFSCQAIAGSRCQPSPTPAFIPRAFVCARRPELVHQGRPTFCQPIDKPPLTPTTGRGAADRATGPLELRRGPMVSLASGSMLVRPAPG